MAKKNEIRTFEALHSELFCLSWQPYSGTKKGEAHEL